MTTWLSFLTVGMLLLQEPDSAQIRELIDRLEADRREDRDRAAADLKKLGNAAVPELEKARKDPRPEVAARVQSVLRVIQLRSSLSAPLLAIVPDADERLAEAGDAEWTRVFLRAAAMENGLPVHPELSGDDLAPLAPKAVRGATEERDRTKVLDALGHFRIVEAAPDVAKLVVVEDDTLRGSALIALGKIGARAFRRPVESCLNDARASVRSKAVWAIGAMRSVESGPALFEVLAGTDLELLPTTLRVLADLDVPDAGSKILPFLGHADPLVRAEAANALGSLGGRDRIPDIVRSAADQAPAVRVAAAQALGALDAADQVDVLLKLLKDEAVQVRRAAAQSLGRLRAAAAAPALAAVMNDEKWFPLRSAAAGALCETGSREGVVFILEQSHEFPPLNALRRPAAWQQLAARRVDREDEGSVQNLLERLAGDGGLTLELPSDLPPEMKSALRSRGQLWRKGRSTPLSAAIRSLTLGWAEVVVEDRALRLIPRSQAAAFWKAWAAEPR